MRIGLTLKELHGKYVHLPKGVIVELESYSGPRAFYSDTYITIKYKGKEISLAEQWPMFIKELSKDGDLYLARLLWE